MPAYKPTDYEDVDTRLHKFWEKYPTGRMHTELVSHTDTQFIVKAYAYRDDEDEAPASTGYAEERVGSTHVNKTSALENCETSAVGRALANLGLSPKGARPSQEEMEKAGRVTVAADVDAIENAMRTAPSLAVLLQVGEKAGNQDMTDEQRKHLRGVYLERKAELEEVKA